MTLEEARLYVHNYENYINFFGEELFAKCLSQFPKEDFSTFKYVIRDGGEDNYFAKKGYPVLCDKTSHPFKEYNNQGWEREVTKLAREYRVPCSYQNQESKLLRLCLIALFPYLAEFDCNMYHFDNEEKTEIYIRPENDSEGKSISSLYVPLQALKQNNYKIIEDRMISYYNSYYNTPRPDKEELMEKMCYAPLKSEVAKKLKAFLDMSEEELTNYVAPITKSGEHNKKAKENLLKSLEGITRTLNDIQVSLIAINDDSQFDFVTSPNLADLSDRVLSLAKNINNRVYQKNK